VIHPLRTHYDKLLLALAIVILGCSLDWVRRQQPAARLVRNEAGSPNPPLGNFVPIAPKPPAASAPAWSEPVAESRGAGWRYEVFTPPVMHYSAATRSFALTSRQENGAGEDETKSPAPVLSPQRPEDFRLQLAGYFGAPNDYIVAFRSPLMADTLLARVGHRFIDLELTFRSFDVRKVLVAETESGPVYEVAALATLFDERSNREVVLDSRTRQPADTLLAQTGSDPEPASPMETKRLATNDH